MEPVGQRVVDRVDVRVVDQRLVAVDDAGDAALGRVGLGPPTVARGDGGDLDLVDARGRLHEGLVGDAGSAERADAERGHAPNLARVGRERGSLIRGSRQASLVPMALTDRDRAILDFERTWWTEPGPKDTAIRDRFELSGTRYYQLLTELLDDAEALAYDPLLVRRLRRARDRRRRARVEGRPVSQLDGR